MTESSTSVNIARHSLKAPKSSLHMPPDMVKSSKSYKHAIILYFMIVRFLPDKVCSYEILTILHNNIIPDIHKVCLYNNPHKADNSQMYKELSKVVTKLQDVVVCRTLQFELEYSDTIS